MKITVKVSALLTALLLASCSTMDAVDLIANAAKPHPAPAAPPPPNPPPANDAAPPPPPPGQNPGPAGNQQSGPARGGDAAAQADLDKYSNAPFLAKTYAAERRREAGLQVVPPSKVGDWAVYRSSEIGKVKAIIKMAVVSVKTATRHHL